MKSPLGDAPHTQRQVASTFDWLDLPKLGGVEDERAPCLDEARLITVACALRGRIETLKELSGCGVYAVPGTGHDVTEDIGYSGQSEQ